MARAQSTSSTPSPTSTTDKSGAVPTVTSSTTTTSRPEISPAPDATLGSASPARSVAGKPTNALPPEKARPVKLVLFAKPPTIDGKLDDEVWKSAPVFKDFYQWRPSDSSPASARTEVMAGYDSRYIYFAFHAFDDPSKVRASVAKRDSILTTIRLDCCSIPSTTSGARMNCSLIRWVSSKMDFLPKAATTTSASISSWNPRES